MFDITVFFIWIRKNITMRDILIISGIILLYGFTRLINLTKFPIFTDESLYIFWSLVAWKNEAWRFISLTDGKQPLQTWATIPFLKLFQQDKLLAGRLFSVSFGFLGLAGFFNFMWYEFGKKASYITATLYLFTPYFLFYDRLALVDSAISALVIWMFFFSVVMARTLRLDIALILGLLTGVALLGKSSVRLYVGLMFFSFIFIRRKDASANIHEIAPKLLGKDHTRKELVNFLILYCIVVVLSLAIYNIQRLSPYMHIIEQKNMGFVLTFSELLKNPLAYFPLNIRIIPYYILSEMGYVIGLIGIAGLFIMYGKHKVLALYITVWLILGILIVSFVGIAVYPRYLLLFGGLLLIPAGYVLAELKNKRIFAAMCAAILLSVIYFNYSIIYKPVNIPFPEIDRVQYLEGWSAGWGIKEITDYARTKAADKPVYIVAEGIFGMSGTALKVHINDTDNVTVKAYWPLSDKELAENQALLGYNHVYVVYPHCKGANYKSSISDGLTECMNFEKTKPLKLIRVFNKPGNSAAIYLFELIPAKFQ